MLTPRQQLLAAIIDAIGGVDLTRFRDRLLLQKRVFLLMVKGIDLGYSFSWYLRGPYCPALTKDAFAVDEEMRRVSPMWTGFATMPATLKQGIADVRNAFGAYWNDPEQLELLASVLFLVKSTGELDPKVIAKSLHELKPRFDLHKIGASIQWLRENKLVHANQSVHP